MSLAAIDADDFFFARSRLKHSEAKHFGLQFLQLDILILLRPMIVLSDMLIEDVLVPKQVAGS